MRAEVYNSTGPIWERTLADKGISMMIKYFRLILPLIYVDVWKLASSTEKAESRRMFKIVCGLSFLKAGLFAVSFTEF